MSLRADVEDFLFAEVALLDEWRLDEWVALFTDDAHYRIPCLGIDDPTPDTMILLDDDMDRLRGRVKRLNSRRAYREFPYARVRHFVANVRVTDGDVVTARSNFQCRRIRDDDDYTFSGRYEHTLRRDGGSFRIADRVAVLDQLVLRPHGTIGILL